MDLSLDPPTKKAVTKQQDQPNILRLLLGILTAGLFVCYAFNFRPSDQQVINEYYDRLMKYVGTESEIKSEVGTTFPLATTKMPAKINEATSSRNIWLDIHQNIFNPEDKDNFWFRDAVEKFGKEFEKANGGISDGPTWRETPEDHLWSYKVLDKKYVYDQESYTQIKKHNYLFGRIPLNAGLEEDIWRGV